MLKHGLIQDRLYWETLKKAESLEDMKKHILSSIKIKNNVVLQDPTEQNIRKILNYGHTLGHAIESYFLENDSKETLLHGEAIAIGMILEGYLSYKLTNLPLEDLNDIKTTFLSRYEKVEFLEDDFDNILKLMKYDKKNSHGKVNFVLLKKIGNPVFDIEIPVELFAKAFAYYKV